jgi:hypothetical protein
LTFLINRAIRGIRAKIDVIPFSPGLSQTLRLSKGARSKGAFVAVLCLALCSVLLALCPYSVSCLLYAVFFFCPSSFELSCPLLYRFLASQLSSSVDLSPLSLLPRTQPPEPRTHPYLTIQRLDSLSPWTPANWYARLPNRTGDFHGNNAGQVRTDRHSKGCSG